MLATRYVTPLREGGSLPAIIEADDLGMYVLKFRGAGQGVLALLAELVAGEIGRAVGLRVPELVFVQVAPELGRNEGDPEIQSLLQSSIGLNLGMDYLPGSVMFNQAAHDLVDEQVASLAVWFDAFVTNVDRTARNPNLLSWHRNLYFIDHGAALYFHHDWGNLEEKAKSRFPVIKSHLLLPWAGNLRYADVQAPSRLAAETIFAILSQVPDAWLVPEEGAPDAATKREQYLSYFQTRLQHAENFVQEAIDARSRLL